MTPDAPASPPERADAPATGTRTPTQGPPDTPATGADTSGSVLYASRRRFDRVRLLNEELDRLGTDATARTASVSIKASALAVSAGVLFTAATAQVWNVAPRWA